EKDFGELKHYDGISPAWPISYAELEPYYAKAEEMYHVHGLRGHDPTEPPASSPYPCPPVSHEPRIASSTSSSPPPATARSPRRSRSCWTSGTWRIAPASAARPAMAFLAWCMPNPTRKSWQCVRRSSFPMSRYCATPRQ